MNFWNKEKVMKIYYYYQRRKNCQKIEFFPMNDWSGKMKFDSWITWIFIVVVDICFLLFVSYLEKQESKKKLFEINIYLFMIFFLCLFVYGRKAISKMTIIFIWTKLNLSECVECVCVCKKYLLKKYGIYNGCA